MLSLAKFRQLSLFVLIFTLDWHFIQLRIWNIYFHWKILARKLVISKSWRGYFRFLMFRWCIQSDMLLDCKKSSNNLIGSYSKQIWTLNTQCFIVKLAKLRFEKIFFPRKFFHVKKAFSWQFDSIKKNSFSRIDFFLKKIKWFYRITHWIFFQVTLNMKSTWHCLTIAK